MYLPGSNRALPLVLEMGSKNTRFGYGGEMYPFSVQPTVKSQYQEIIQMNDGTFQKIPQKIYYHDEVENFQSIVSSVQDNQFNYDSIEFSLSDLLFEQYDLNPEDHPILIVEPVIKNKEYRIKLVEMLFDKFGFKGVFFQKAPILASYLFGNQNIIVIDSGASQTQIVPIFEGQIYQKALVKTSIGGNYLTEKFYEVLQSRHQNVPSRFVNTRQKELYKYGQMQFLEDAKHNIFKVYDQDLSKINFNSLVDNQIYELPDQKLIDVSREMYDIPELMFKQNETEHYYGLAQSVFQAMVMLEPEYRKDFLSNIFVVGGNTLFSNFMNRLQQDLYSLEFWGLQSKIKVQCSNTQFDRQHANWIGGSIMASMPNFESIMMTKEDYEENGFVLIDKKCFD